MGTRPIVQRCQYYSREIHEDGGQAEQGVGMLTLICLPECSIQPF